jgi:5-azacytidine-induced protein 1
MQRHLDLIDRLLADKDALGKQVEECNAAVEAEQAKHSASVDALKAGWATELRKQREHWCAAENLKRDSWLAEKTKEIKEVTIKGLEPEIQALVQRHRKEMSDLQDRCHVDAKRQMDALASQHDMYVRCEVSMACVGREGTIGCYSLAPTCSCRRVLRLVLEWQVNTLQGDIHVASRQM